MKIAFRVDSSLVIGSGHLMRCLTLADELKNAGLDVVFVSYPHLGSLHHLALEKGFKVFLLPLSENNTIGPIGDLAHSNWLGSYQESDAAQTLEVLSSENCNWMVVDHYGVDHRWHNLVRLKIPKTMVIDDLADRKHSCDILLDQNFYRNLDHRYDQLVPMSCTKFLGPKFALLRPEFYIWRKRIGRRVGPIKGVFVFFGGSDLTNQTLATLKELSSMQWQFNVNVVIGLSHPSKEEIAEFCTKKSWDLHIQTNKMAELMSQSDLAIGAGGVTSLERACMGLPSIVIAVAENQVETSVDLASKGAILYAGKLTEKYSERLRACLSEVFSDSERLSELSNVALNLMGPGESTWKDSIVPLIVRA
jgi:UDP-2,4-diacetamido-2,4,6-trideoxy-beta-L-altropyranose hydrolase